MERYKPSEKLLQTANTCVRAMLASRTLLLVRLMEDGWEREEAINKIEEIWRWTGEECQMSVKITIADGRRVRVLNRLCRDNSCLVVGRYTHRSAAGASGCSSWVNEELSCLTWENHGCPPEERRRLNPDALHRCEKPVFGTRIKSREGPRVRCNTCKELVPRWVAHEQQK